LCQSHREGQKIIKTTILNITGWGEKNSEAFAALSDSVLLHNKPPEIVQGKSLGTVWLLYILAKQIGLVDALGNSRNCRLALW
jgi:hypothetical protein